MQTREGTDKRLHSLVPSQGPGAILTDDNGTANSRVIYAYFDLGGSKSVDAGQTLTLQNLEMKLSDS